MTTTDDYTATVAATHVLYDALGGHVLTCLLGDCYYALTPAIARDDAHSPAGVTFTVSNEDRGWQRRVHITITTTEETP